MSTKYGVVTNPDTNEVEGIAQSKVAVAALPSAKVMAQPGRCPWCKNPLDAQEYDPETLMGLRVCPNCGSAPFER